MTKQFSHADIQLRDCHADDIDALVQLWYQSWHYAYPDLTHSSPIEDWNTRLIREIIPTSKTIIAENLERKILGFMSICIEENYLSQLFINVKFQGQELGSCLINEAKLVYPNQLNLHTLEHNLASRKFYEKHGFSEGKKSINPINKQVSIHFQWQAD